MAWSPWLTNLNDVLADLYPTIQDSRRLVAAAGLRASLISFHERAVVNWFNILTEAANQGGDRNAARPVKVVEILDLAQRDYPRNDLLIALERDEPPAVKGPDIGGVDWHPTVNAELEKIIGKQSTLLPIAFLEIGLKRARSVARVVLSDGSSGTGFLIGNGWLLTNHHVLPSAGSVEGAVAEFNYQKTAAGLDAPIERVPLQPANGGFMTDEADDWSVIRVPPEVESKWDTLSLSTSGVRKDDFVNIIQHPGGGPKQIGIYHNTVAYADRSRVQYLTDTLPGSSGAPVFNDAWEVVALHHSGGMLREPDSKQSFFRNEGVAVAALVEGFKRSRIEFGGSGGR